jgi:hypothetical protein
MKTISSDARRMDLEDRWDRILEREVKDWGHSYDVIKKPLMTELFEHIHVPVFIALRKDGYV